MNLGVSTNILSWILIIIGGIGFILSGRKIWWAWYVNIANQILWVVFAIMTGYYAFLLSAAFYTTIFIQNAYLWTRDKYQKSEVSRDTYCRGSWDGINNWISPNCRVPGYPHAPHSVDNSAWDDGWDIDYNDVTIPEPDAETPSFSGIAPFKPAFIHPRTPTYIDAIVNGPEILCTGRPRHKLCQEPVLAHKPHFLKAEENKDDN